MKKIYTTIFILITTLSSCVDQLEFTVSDNVEKLLIVDGFIHTLNGPHTVKLSYAAPFKNDLDGGIEEPITDAVVSIIDDQNTLYRMFHAGLGVYSSTYSYKGIVGRSYKLNVRIGDKTYESAFSKMPEPPVVDQVYYERVEKQVLEDGVIKTTPGLQFYADLSYQNGESYYLLDWDGTYVFPTLTYQFTGINCASVGGGPRVCYVKDTKGGWVDVFSNEKNTVTNAVKVPISFTKVDRKFIVKYSYNVRFYNTDLAGFQFHDLVHKQTTATGSVFDPAPAKIDGNMRNINDPNEKVLGYFGAFGASEKRVFIEPDMIPFSIDNTLPTACENDGSDPAAWCCNCLFWPNSTSNKPIFWD